MSKHLFNKLELALVTPEAVEAWNTVVNARKMFFVLCYKTKIPTLYVGTKDHDPEPLLVVDTRKLTIEVQTITNQNAALGVADLTERLAKLGLRMTLQYKQNKQKQKTISLRFVSLTGGPMTTVMDTVKKGEQKTYVQFKLNDRW